MGVRERIDIKSTGGRSEIHAIRKAGVTSRVYGFSVFADNLFGAGSGATQSRAMRIDGERPAANVMGGDAHDWLLQLSYTNRAVNTPAGSYCRAISAEMQIRDSGAISSLQSGMFSTRVRGDAGAVPEQRPLRADLTHDVGAAAATGLQECFRANIKIHANGAAHADTAGASAIVANNDATGSYTNKPNAFAVRSLGQPFLYLLDLYDSRVKLADRIMRLPVVDSGSLPCVWFVGTATSDGDIVTDVGADTLWADGSMYSSISDGAGALYIKKNDVWTATA